MVYANSVHFFLKTSPSDTLSICVVVLQENGAEVPGGVSRWAGITEHSHNELPENASPHWGNRCLFLSSECYVAKESKIL